MKSFNAKLAIPEGLSIYLDLIRFGAALIVVMSHVWSLLSPNFYLPWPGHSAVVLFFVLSGFVISHAARPEIGLSGYVQHRIARIYPVVLAALLLSLLLDIKGIDGIMFADVEHTGWLNFILSLVFLGQSWANLSPPFNEPFWSLNYEVWYYILFGIWHYCRCRLPLLLIAALITGPKILLLLPVWLLGVLLHKYIRPIKHSTAVYIFSISLVSGLAFFWFDVGIHIREAMRSNWPMFIRFAQGSNQFVGDTFLGLIVFFNLFAAGSLGMDVLLKMKNSIRYLSSFTFSMYIFHMPLATLIWNGLGVRHPAAFLGLLSIGVFILGSLTERRTKWYRSILDRFFFIRRKKEERPLSSITSNYNK